LRVGAVVAVALVSAACTRTYTVRATHLARARHAQREGIAIAAVDRDGEETALQVGAIDFRDPPDPATGMQRVEVVDTRPVLRISGWIAAGIGIAFLAQAAEGSTGDSYLLPGVVVSGAGLFLLLAGYLFFDPEADASSPGLPATVRDP
jgi:hypothetical protein